MIRIHLLYRALFWILVLGLLHFVAGVLYLYWTLWWFDCLMHFLAGFGGGLVALWFYLGLSPDSKSLSNFLTFAFLPVLMVGIGWEVFENINNLTASTENYIVDTGADLIMDVLGALLAGVIGWKRSRQLS